ncbi:MAG: permease [Elusimicrobia bacterium]|nr:permease [Elusimicrobiota bacterium]
MSERTKLGLIAGIFLAIYYAPFSHPRVQNSILEAFWMLQDYAHHHVLTCLIPAFFIAGAISVFVSRASVMKYFGAKADKVLSYGVASVSGAILAVCSCTVLPIYAGISQRGAGIGPAAAFLYSGPAINVLAIILTARVLGLEMGLARAVGAISFSVLIGLAMAFIFRHEEKAVPDDSMFSAAAEEAARPLWKEILYFLSMICVLVFAAWAKPEQPVGFFDAVYRIHWRLAGASFIALFWMLAAWFKKEELASWTGSTWEFAKQIFPLLLGGVFVAGLLMGRPGLDNGLIPNRYVAMLVGGNSIWANLFASVAGALMYFATLTEVPILQGLMGSGMGKGPALALLLAGPALSLPSVIVLNKIMGAKKMLAYVGLVVGMSTLAGMAYGALF